ncbi:MAG: hypothetical protein M1826_006102 [Phylliscum demangeonii]|nr:MAG: hypothetical protein M1826_006102 [Phylliscum demangeonii]
MSSASPVNGKPSITSNGPIAVGVPGLPIVVGHHGLNGAASAGDHARKSSVTITAAAAATAFMANGGPVVASSGRPTGLQFGSAPAMNSPASSFAVPHHSPQGPSSLAVSTPSNPRVLSPQSSPSPIPQPPESGGRPPASLQAQVNAMNFGAFMGEPIDAQRSLRPNMPAHMPMGPNQHGTHFRRESSHSAHSDLANAGYANGPGRASYHPPPGRGRGYAPPMPHPQQMAHPPGPGYRTMPHAQRGGHNMTAYPVGASTMRNHPDGPFRNSRSPGPMMAAPPMQPVQMAGAQMPPGQYAGYPMNVGGPPVSSFSPAHSVRRRPWPNDLILPPYPGPAFDFHRALPAPNLAPESGFMDQFLTWRHMQTAYGSGQPFDPVYGHGPSAMALYPNMFPVGGPPSSPRPAHSPLPPGPPPPQYYPGPYGLPQAPSMSRTSSAVSDQRPSSSLGHLSAPSLTPAMAPAPLAHQAKDGPVSPAVLASTFKIPNRRSAGIPIKDPKSGALLNFDKPDLPPTFASGPPVIVSSTATPPRAPTRPESKGSEADEAEKRKESMKDAVAKKVEAEKAEERRRHEEEEARKAREREQEEEKRRAQEEAEEAAAKEKQEADRVEREAAEQAQRAKAEVEERARDAHAAAEKAQREAREREEQAAEEKEKAQRDAHERAEAETKLKAEEDAREQRRRDEEARLAEKRRADERLQQERAASLAKEAGEADRRANAVKAEVPAGAAPPPVAPEHDGIPAAKADGEAKPDGAVHTGKDAPEVASLKSLPGSGASTPSTQGMMGPPPKPSTARGKPAALNLAPLKTNAVEPPPPSAALQSLRSARFITRINEIKYPPSIQSPLPGLNAKPANQGFKYNRVFLRQFHDVFIEKPNFEWDGQLKDSMGAIGDSARPQSARAPSMSGRSMSARGGIMGQFAQAGQRPLPAGTTSEQRFNNSNMQNMQRHQTMNNPLAHFARQGGFTMGSMGAGPAAMLRTNSSTSLTSAPNAVPSSPRPGPTRSQRNNSKRPFEKAPSKAEDHAANKSMPLTQGLDLKPLLPSTTGWKPRSLAGSASATGAAGPPPGSVPTRMEPDMVQRKVKAALNKMTPEKFDKISDQILEIAAQSKDESDGRTLRQIIQLTFEKATDEAHWASMYAKFCRRMLESMSPDIKDDGITDKNGNVVTGGNLFRKYLLNRCQEEFERGWKINLPPKPEGEMEAAAMLSDDYYIAAAAKRRGLGLVQFIGEMYKLNMLTERIMHECVKKLVDYDGIPDEAEIESLTKLLRTIGPNLEETDRSRRLMEAYFMQITNMVATPELPSRMTFMLMDIIDLRKAGWVSKDDNKGPQTIQAIHEKAQRDQAEKEAERARQPPRHGGGGGGGRMPMGRNDPRSFSGGGGGGGGGGYGGGNMPPPDYNRNTVGMDELRRLKQASSRPSNQGQASLGPTLAFSQRTSSGRKGFGPGGSLRGGGGGGLGGGEESGASSRTGTPPAANKDKDKDKESSTSANAFGLLASLESSDPTESASPPSAAAASPPITKARPGLSGSNSKSDVNRDRAAGNRDKAKDGESRNGGGS